MRYIVRLYAGPKHPNMPYGLKLKEQEIVGEMARKRASQTYGELVKTGFLSSVAIFRNTTLVEEITP